MKQRLSLLGAIKSNTIGLFTKRDFLIIAFFTLLGAGGVFAATLITITTPDSQGAAYAAATACDENVTLRALTASDAATGQLYVATIALSDISQNATTGCGNKTMQVALKINNQMRYATWDIQAASTDSTFYLTSATSSISDYYADTLLSPFQADGLTNVAIANIGSFTNTYTWSQVATSRNWYSITSSSDGTKLAAVIYGSYIWTSNDSGATWTASSTDASRSWRSITSSSDGTKLAAVTYAAGGYTGYIYTSTNSGASWTEQTAAGSRLWFSITSSSDGTKLAAVVQPGYIYTSTNSGVTWTVRQPIDATNRYWTSITSSSDGTKLAAVIYGSYIYTSTDSGVNWTVRQPIDATNRYWTSITSSSDGTKLAAVVSGGYIYTSTDSGATWTEQTAAGSRYWYSITSSSDGTKLAAVVTAGASKYIYTSTDSGATWTEQTAAGSRYWYSITSSSDGTKLAAAANGGFIYTGVGSISRSSN
jgi:hypothetical protein